MSITRNKDDYLIQVSYKDPFTGNYRRLSARRRGIKRFEAQEIERELQKKAEQLAKGIVIETKNQTVSEAAKEFLAYEYTQRRLTTMKHKKQVINNYVIDYFKEAPISTLLSIAVWMKWREYINNYVSNRTHKPLADSAKNSILKDVSAFMSYLNKYKDFDIRAFKKLEKFKDPNLLESKKIQFWTLEEFKAVDKVLEDNCLTLKQYIARALINTLFFTGMRKSEAYALTWKDFYKVGDNYFLDINKSLSQKVHGKDGAYFVAPTKNKSSKRKIMIIDYVANLLQEIKKKSLIKSDDDFIFGGYSPISDTYLAKTLNKAATKASIHHIKVHDLRHSFVTMLINKDVNIKTISALVGHATTTMTWNTYGHLYPEKENNAIALLNEEMKK